MPEQGPDPIIERVAAELRSARGPDASFDARVMAGVRAAPPSAAASLWTWLKEPRAVAVSPLGGLAAAALLALVMAAGFWVAGSRGLQGNIAAAPETRSPAPGTAFILLDPTATTVSIVGDFNGWDPARTPLTRAASAGFWTVEVPLAPGRYSYAFVVDGRRFVPDPAAPRAVGDDFGTPTSVVTVAGGSL